jgi:hypothetical protein
MCSLKFLPQAEDRKTGYLFFNTDDKVIGMIKTPMDGNPYRNIGIIAHPGEVNSKDVVFFSLKLC